MKIQIFYINQEQLYKVKRKKLKKMKIKFNEVQFGNNSVENQEKLQITIPEL